ncbi:uncharacterized protein LOC118437571 [Folsomia candida]|uniref:uncharacterized protein LOC118437571 n=1 Tax=Folsomia candida TaxID=158441 RepID=UPI001604D83C|nr:uncharacterized protein LOC118437571 [Folsomia candida]XP_035712603.1 uncharacterized protein LOC118437571 [Folsomia candida]
MDHDLKCWRVEREECTVLINFAFEKNFTEIRVRMVVENWHWGSFGFTTDHFLLDDIGFYCGEMEPFVWTQVHLNHTTLKGSYKGLEENLVKIVTFKEQAGEMKRYCEWIMPSKFKVHQGSFNTTRDVNVNLVDNEYHVLMTVGKNVSYHSAKQIMPHKFGKKAYLSLTGEKDAGSAATPTSIPHATLVTFLILNLYSSICI